MGNVRQVGEHEFDIRIATEPRTAPQGQRWHTVRIQRVGTPNTTVRQFIPYERTNWVAALRNDTGDAGWVTFGDDDAIPYNTHMTAGDDGATVQLFPEHAATDGPEDNVYELGPQPNPAQYLTDLFTAAWQTLTRDPLYQPEADNDDHAHHQYTLNVVQDLLRREDQHVTDLETRLAEARTRREELVRRLEAAAEKLL